MADITSNLVAHWNLNETSGSTLADSSGNGYSLTTANSPTLGGTTIGGSLSTNVAFNGSNQQATKATASAIAKNVSAFTVATWFKTSTTTGNRSLVRFGDGVSSWRFDLTMLAGSQLRAGAKAGDGESQQFRNLSAGWTDGAWHHCAAVVNLASDTITIYVDGAAQSATGSVSFTATATSNTDALYVAVGSANSASYFLGSLDDVRIYNRALAADDVAALYDLAKPQNTVAPGFTGDCIVGQTLSGTSGTWTDGSVNARKWQSATDGSGTGVADISGATSADFTITESELDKYVRYAVQYSNGIGTTWAYSSWMGSIESATSLYRPRCPSFSLTLPTLSLG